MLSYFARLISHFFLNEMQEKRRLTGGGGGGREQEASPPAHCMFRRSMPGFLALDSILHTWYKTKTNLSYPQNSHYIPRRLSVKEPKQIKQI